MIERDCNTGPTCTGKCTDGAAGTTPPIKAYRDPEFSTDECPVMAMPPVSDDMWPSAAGPDIVIYVWDPDPAVRRQRALRGLQIRSRILAEQVTS